ncbi:hypothetical protein Dda_3523 [Drechslerella dactyloides]|uniref:Rad21/Rec8-like protein N-terminal domain-containing protein n=1 Tax=Drechslerella dactyloides TaxID=74499 RepID=A0AAD6J2L2_DREDA|nr:hypothetical protein Dda_3523 [Drechslerella dactyloides]
MFYDHRILTQRKYGVATVWLVATIGSKSSLSKKIHKKEILEVNLAKACRTIIQSENPLALRLQSNLLFGVSRVFFEQYSYLFTDVSNAHQRISKDLIHFDTGKIDLVVSRTRPETLLLQDDPAFVPDLAFLTLDIAGLPEDRLNAATQLTIEDKTLLPSEQSDSIHRSGDRRASFGQLVIPDSSFLDESGTDLQPSIGGDFQVDQKHEDQFDDSVDFVFDENGELQDVPVRHQLDFDDNHEEAVLGLQDLPIETPKHNRWGNIFPSSERVRREHEEGKQNFLANQNLVDLDNLEDNFSDFRIADNAPSAEPFPRCNHQDHEAEGEEDEIAPVLLKPKRRIRMARADEALELRTSELAAFGSNYLGNMEAARNKRSNFQKMHMAKKFALECVYGWSGMLRAEALQSMFNGKNIIQVINSNFAEQSDASVRGRKRGLDETGEDESESESEGSQRGRRVRGEPSSDQMGYDLNMHVDNADFQHFNIEDEEPERARRASTQLDINTAPWNAPQRISRSGSILSFGGFGTSSIGGIPSSVNRMFSSTGRRIGSPTGQLGSSRGFARRGVRLTSSPLARHIATVTSTGAGPGVESQFSLSSETDIVRDDEDNDIPQKDKADDPVPHDSAGVRETQNSQLLAETLERESGKFYEYLAFQLNGKYGNDEHDDVDEIRFIDFEDLISPNYISSAFAAQAFHHTLQLATVGAIRVKQGHQFGPISITLAAWNIISPLP